MWEQLNRLYLHVNRNRSPRGSAFYMRVKEAAHLFQGVTDSTMIHSEGWHYIQIGRSIERAAATATMLEVHFEDRPMATVTAASARTSRGRHCCAPARPSRRTASDTPPIFGPNVLPSSCCSTPIFRGRCGLRSTASRPHCARSPDGWGAARRAASTGWPAGCAPRSTTARSTKSWPTASRATCKGIRQTMRARAHGALSDLHQLSHRIGDRAHER